MKRKLLKELNRMNTNVDLLLPLYHLINHTREVYRGRIPPQSLIDAEFAFHAYTSKWPRECTTEDIKKMVDAAKKKKKKRKNLPPLYEARMALNQERSTDV